MIVHIRGLFCGATCLGEILSSVVKKTFGMLPSWSGLIHENWLFTKSLKTVRAVERSKMGNTGLRALGFEEDRQHS